MVFQGEFKNKQWGVPHLHWLQENPKGWSLLVVSAVSEGESLQC